MKRKDGTFVDVTEDMINQLSDDVDIYIDSVIEALMPDGRPFGMELKDPEEELQDYMNLRGNARAWWDWMAVRYDYIVSKMQQMLTPEQMAKVHPWDLVYRYAINFSAKMEKLYARMEQKRLQQELDNYQEFRVDDMLEEGEGIEYAT